MKFITLLPILFTYSSTWLIQGLQHPVLTPSHVILVFSLAFLIGQQGKLVEHIVIFLVAVIAGMFANYYLQPNPQEISLLVLALIVGLLVVVRIKTKSLIMLCLSFIIAILMGFYLG